MGYELMGRLHAELLGLTERGFARDRERGQGTVEYVGLILLLAVILTAVIAAAKHFNGAKSIPATIMQKLEEAVKGIKPS